MSKILYEQRWPDAWKAVNGDKFNFLGEDVLVVTAIFFAHVMRYVIEETEASVVSVTGGWDNIFDTLLQIIQEDIENKHRATVYDGGGRLIDEQTIRPLH